MRAWRKVWGLVRTEEALFRRLAPLAATPHERVSLALFVGKHAAARLSRYRYFHGDTSIAMQGRKYVVGVISGEVELLPEIYASRIYDRRKEFLPHPVWTVFDVGANIGLFSLLAAERGARVYAFEPNQECFRRLDKNVSENGYTNVVATYNTALGREAGRATLHVPWQATHSGSLTVELDRPRTDTVSVEVRSLDQIRKDLGVERVDLLKVDVEGAELAVLQGGRETLARTERVIIEYHSQLLRTQVTETLNAAGFSLAEDVLCYPPDVGILYAYRTD